MLGTGGSALVAAQLGAEKHRCALQNFSLLVAGCVVLSTLLAVLGLLFFILFYTASVRMTCFTRFVRHMRARFFWRLRSPWQALFLISSSLRRGSRGLRCFLRSSAGS